MDWIVCTIRKSWLELWDGCLGPFVVVGVFIGILTGIVLGVRWFLIHFFGEATSGMILLVIICTVAGIAVLFGIGSGICRIIQIARQCRETCDR